MRKQSTNHSAFCCSHLRTDSSETTHSNGCFSANSTVLTSGGERRRLADLQPGESVLSMDTAGRPVYSEVLMFMDRDTNQQREFVRIDTDGGAHITVTPGHLLYVWKRATAETAYMYADRVEEGDHLLVVGADGQLEPRAVRRISAERHRGVFAPLTREGTIVVDGVTASCYAMVDSQRIAHWSFGPVRAWRTVQRWLDFSRGRKEEEVVRSARAATVAVAEGVQEQQTGMHWYARALFSIKDLFLPSSWIYQR